MREGYEGCTATDICARQIGREVWVDDAGAAWMQIVPLCKSKFVPAVLEGVDLRHVMGNAAHPACA